MPSPPTNNHPYGLRRTPHPNETVEAYTARMTVDENARKREAFAKFIAARGTTYIDPCAGGCPGEPWVGCDDGQPVCLSCGRATS